MKRELHKWYGVATDNVFVIPNGVDYERYASAKCTPQVLEHLGNFAGEKVVIVFCGRLLRMKNVSFLLRAFARMNSRNDCLLALVGMVTNGPHLRARLTS